MNMNEDKDIERLVEQMMKSQTLEKPTFDFTSNIMAQVTANQKAAAFAYKPLITKQTVLVICGFVLLLVFFVLMTDNSSSSRFMIPFDYTSNLAGLLSHSKVATFSVTVTAVMLFVQIALLKKHFYRRFDV
jgi:hypothetical protein